MFKKTMLFLSLIVLAACSGDDNPRDRNPYLLDIGFSITLNTNLPQYSSLQFTGNAVYIPNVGNKGIFVINTGTGIRAWEASDPNHQPNECSTMELNGVEVTCPCDDTTYNLYNGLAMGVDVQYPLLEYRAVATGSGINISN